MKELILSRHELIKDLYPLTLDNTYASSILFPFANRTKMEAMNLIAKYINLISMKKGLNSALHGLIYNKTFEVISKKINENSASVNLVYHEKQISNEFPQTELYF